MAAASPANGHADGVVLIERLAELELAVEEQGWLRVGVGIEREFSREGLRRIVQLSRLMFLKNPLINRPVTLQSFYVWGQGVQITARHPKVKAVVQRFLDDPKNKAELTGHKAHTEKENDLQVDGNLFFVFFTNKASGRVRVRSIQVDEITEIISNPEDSKEPWYYKRQWTQRVLDVKSGAESAEARTLYYPDWEYRPQGTRPATIGGAQVDWDTPVHQVKVGGLSHMRFGIPETYQAIDWALAYKDFLGDVATLMRAVARFAAKVTVPGGPNAVAAGKAKLGTTLSPDNTESNPAPVTGSIFLQAEGTNYQPLPLRGATVDPEDGRRFILMVAAATGLPEFMFGDANVGNHATAKTLDRPTELKFKDRQTLWADTFQSILAFVIDQAALATKGPIRGELVMDDDIPTVVLETDPETGDPIDRTIDIQFPTILEHSVLEQVQAIVQAATLDGKAPVTLDLKTTTRMLLVALGADDIDQLLEELFPDPAEPDPKAPMAVESTMLEAARELRDALIKLREGRS